MTPAELAKVTKAMRDLGFSNAEIDACGGDQVALLNRISAERSSVTRSGTTVVYGARRINDKKIADVDGHLARALAKVIVSKKVI